MRVSIAALVVSLGLTAALPARAQVVDSGREFQVNPVSPAGNVLLYPGGQYMRTVPQLRQPGDNGAPIRLHMPTKGARKPAPAVKAAAPRPKPKVVAGAPAPRPKVAARVPAARPAAPKSAPASTVSPYMAAPGAAGIFGRPSGSIASIVPATVPPPAAPPKAQAATAEPNGGMEGLTDHKVILFAANAEEPAESAHDAIRFLAGDLMNAMTRPASRVWLMGHGGAKGDKGSDARRLSLKRALAVRQLLIDAGLSTDRISVQAQGGVDDSGPADRVDVYVKE